MLLVVGRIGRAHGVRGDVFVEPFTDEPDQRFAPDSVLVTDDGQTLTVEFTKWHSSKFIVHFVGINDRTAVEALRNKSLQVDVDPSVLPDDPDEFYDHQLIGLRVLDQQSVQVGVVTDVLHPPSQDLLSVTSNSGTELLIPFVAEIVPTVNVAQGFVTITPPNGLLDEALADEVRGE